MHKKLFYGFSEEIPPSQRWQSMAPQKLEELDALLRRTQQMKEMVAKGAACGCRSLEECDVL